jgi:hypothetical protein
MATPLWGWRQRAGKKGSEGFPTVAAPLPVPKTNDMPRHSRLRRPLQAVGFNPRTNIGQPQCVAERRAKPSASVGPTRSTVAPRREIGCFRLPWVKTHGYLQTSLRDGHCIKAGLVFVTAFENRRAILSGGLYTGRPATGTDTLREVLSRLRRLPGGSRSKTCSGVSVTAGSFFGRLAASSSLSQHHFYPSGTGGSRRI